MTVIGVMPDGFKWPFQHEVWTPMTHLPPALRRTRGVRGYLVYGRLDDGVTVEQARSEMTNISAQLAQQYPRHEQRHHGGRDPVSRSHDRTADQNHFLVAHGRGRLRVAHRLLERCQPAARAGRPSHAGDRRSRVARSDQVAHCPAAAGRERAARLRQRRRRPRIRRAPHPLVRPRNVEHQQAVLDGFHDGRRRLRVLCRGLSPDRNRLRPRTGAPHLEDQRERGPEGRWPFGIGRAPRAPLDDGAHRHRARADAGPARRCRVHDAQLPQHVPAGRRLRYVTAADHGVHACRIASTRAARSGSISSVGCRSG